MQPCHCSSVAILAPAFQSLKPLLLAFGGSDETSIEMWEGIGQPWKTASISLASARRQFSALSYSDLDCVISIDQLSPVTAHMSRIRSYGNGAHKCIDGITDGPDTNTGDLCHTNNYQAPWLALDFGEDLRVSVNKVVLYNAVGSSDIAARTRNVQIRLSDELPTSDASMFTGGNLLGTFAGPGTSGQLIEIKSGPNWTTHYGRYVIVQMDNDDDPLNLKEVSVFGKGEISAFYTIPI